jgi:hypothetical protein
MRSSSWRQSPARSSITRSMRAESSRGVIGAWFDNHYTLRRGQLFYNGVPCAAVGDSVGAGQRLLVANPRLSTGRGMTRPGKLLEKETET